MNHSFLFSDTSRINGLSLIFPFFQGDKKSPFGDLILSCFSDYHIERQISIFVHIFAHFFQYVFHNASRILWNKEKLLFPCKKYLVETVKNVNLVSILYILVWMHLAED